MRLALCVVVVCKGGSAISPADGHSLIELKVLWLQTPAL